MTLRVAERVPMFWTMMGESQVTPAAYPCPVCTSPRGPGLKRLGPLGLVQTGQGYAAGVTWDSPIIVQNIGTRSATLNVIFYKIPEGTAIASDVYTLEVG